MSKAKESYAKNQLRDMVMAAERTVAFTGAGISTECGIPDFRSPGGIWSKYRPIDFQTFMASAEARREALTRYIKVRESVGSPRPGRGHRALARLAGEGRLSHVITQNIDGLHQASGLEAEQVIELHGNGTYAHCLSCGRRLLAIGSSLVVYPAAGFPLMARRNGAKLVIVNREPTDMDDAADLVVHADIGDVLEMFLP